MATTSNGKLIGWNPEEQIALRKKIEEVQKHPDRHVHRFREDLQACCTVNGQYSNLLLETHYVYSRIHNANNDPCDVLEGPCTCGAWHEYGTPY